MKPKNNSDSNNSGFLVDVRSLKNLNLAPTTIEVDEDVDDLSLVDNLLQYGREFEEFLANPWLGLYDSFYFPYDFVDNTETIGYSELDNFLPEGLEKFLDEGDEL